MRTSRRSVVETRRGVILTWTLRTAAGTSRRTSTAWRANTRGWTGRSPRHASRPHRTRTGRRWGWPAASRCGLEESVCYWTLLHLLCSRSLFTQFYFESISLSLYTKGLHCSRTATCCTINIFIYSRRVKLNCIEQDRHLFQTLLNMFNLFFLHKYE